MHFCIVIMQVESASMHRTILHRNAETKGIVSISKQADVPSIYAQLARVQEENLQLRRWLDVLEELLVRQQNVTYSSCMFTCPCRLMN